MLSVWQRIGSADRSSDGIDDVGGGHDSHDQDEENGVGIAGGGGCPESGSDHGGGGVMVAEMARFLSTFTITGTSDFYITAVEVSWCP